MMIVLFRIFLIAIIVFFALIDTGFDIHFYLISKEKDINKIIFGSVWITILNSILFLGYIVQLIMGIEKLSVFYKPLPLVIKENIYGPLIEEIIYRGIFFNLFRASGFSDISSSLISSLLFGLCNFI
jgi:membrane protease YdiL (CAAX protease family)